MFWYCSIGLSTAKGFPHPAQRGTWTAGSPWWNVAGSAGSSGTAPKSLTSMCLFKLGKPGADTVERTNLPESAFPQGMHPAQLGTKPPSSIDFNHCAVRSARAFGHLLVQCVGTKSLSIRSPRTGSVVPQSPKNQIASCVRPSSVRRTITRSFGAVSIGCHRVIGPDDAITP